MYYIKLAIALSFTFKFNLSFALPYVEVWFLSSSNELEDMQANLLRTQAFPKYSLLSSADPHKNCILQGDYYYQEVWGVHQHRGKHEKVLHNPAGDAYYYSVRAKKRKIYSSKIREDSGSYIPLEVWIDTSQSMAEVDKEDWNGNCYREKFAKSIMRQCGVTKARALSLDSELNYSWAQSFCNTYGHSYFPRLKKYLQKAKARNIIVITDMSQLTTVMSSYLSKIHAKVRGIKKGKEIYSHHLFRMATEQLHLCK